MMRVISGLFDTPDAAEEAVNALREAGVSSGDISLVSQGENDGTLVSVRVDEVQEDAASSILREAGSVNLDDQQADTSGGWTGYDEGADLLNAEVAGRPVALPKPR
jgi:hypothetical protein